MIFRRVIQIVLHCVIVLALLCACTSNSDLSNDESLANAVNQDFQKVYEKYKDQNLELFSIFQKSLNREEENYLKFLYAYMPLSDMADYAGEFYLNHVQLAMAARDSFSWGSSIPENVFRHFVLPHRINNENLDTARAVFFKELYPRIKNLSMEKAALEVNHWCHEKVNYQPTDSRTISPLGAIKTAYARCGEESTFTVTALRAVAIPARQVYTPRWAHVDDNHAWVEVFVNGKWQYMGACEPEPKLNMGWFDAPVLRAMMVHTKAFGKYMGNENIIDSQDKYTTLNSLSNYAPTKDIWLKVIGEEEVFVEFGLYNYAEFYPIKRQEIKKGELAHIKTGLGDLRIFASNKSGKFAINKVSVADVDTILIELDKKIGEEFDLSFENVPPVKKEPAPFDPAGAEENKKRFAEEDQIRNTFISTFYTRKKSDQLAKSLGLDADRLWPLMKETRGNYYQVESYLEKAIEINKEYALDLLETISKKDLHDISVEVLLNHLMNFKIFTGVEYDDGMVKKYILNPRIMLEGLTPYRSFLQDTFKSVTQNNTEQTINNIIEWVNCNISIEEKANYYNVNISPRGVYKLKNCDQMSRKIFFVATLRSLGIPARLEPATHVAQYYKDKWINVSFEKENQVKQPDMAQVQFKTDKKYDVEPLYRIHFSLAKYKDGKFQTLHYGWEKPLSEFSDVIELEAGYYQLLTGNRLKDCSVLVKQQYINIKPGSSTELVIELKEDRKELLPVASGHSLSIQEKVAVIGWIDPHSEPGNHFFNDFESLKETYQSSKIPFTFYCKSDELISKIKEKSYKTAVAKKDIDLKKLKEFYNQTQLAEEIQLPVFVVVNDKGEVFYHSSGYNIGTSEQILKVYNRLK